MIRATAIYMPRTNQVSIVGSDGNHTRMPAVEAFDLAKAIVAALETPELAETLAGRRADDSFHHPFDHQERNAS